MARKGAYQSQRTYATVLVLALRPTHTAWFSTDIAPFRLDDWFGHSDSSLLSSRFILQATLSAGRREALREHYGKMKHPGRKLAKIVLIAIALIVANVALMFHLGFIHKP